MSADQRIHELIAKRNLACEKLAHFKPYTGFVSYYARKNESERLSITNAIASYEKQLSDLIRHMYPDTIVEGNMEATIANVSEVAQMPQQEGRMWNVNPGRAI